MKLRRTLSFAALGFAVAGGAYAQTAVENRDADALAADMRILAVNPIDVEALIIAGELTLRMGDTTAAAGFFGRAEKIDPLNPRIKAGWGSLMVRAERPGMALLRFQEAERRGLDPRRFAADRGLAYDLIGEPERAQRDYRLALSGGPDDEVTRRYALSLAIVGQKEAALKLLDPLLQRSDRAAWRDRAFVLAMSGDTDGAEKIAATMMSPGLGAGLTPFFRRLPQLSALDRAFAVNFGETRSTPERIADAQLVPPLPRLGPDPYAPRVVAAATPVVATVVDDGRKRKKRRKDDLAPAVPVPAVAAPVEVALAPPTYVPPRGVATLAPAPVPPVRVAAVVPKPRPAPAPAAVPPPVRAAAVVRDPVPAPTQSPVAPPTRVAAVVPEPVAAPAPSPAPAPSTAPVRVAENSPPPPTPPPVPTPTPPPVPSPTALPVPVPTPSPAPAPTPAIEVAASTPVAPPVDPAPGVADQPSASEAGVPAPTATAGVSEDTVLARIVAGLGERQAALALPPRRPPPAPVVAPKVEEPKPRLAEPLTRAKPAKDEVAAAPPAAGKGKTKAKGRDDLADLDDAKGRAGKPARDDAPLLDRNGCPIPAKGTRGKPSATTRPRGTGGARVKGADERCRTADAKDKADAAARGEPARVWVQVAGGANAAALEKAWAGLSAKAPDLFRNRQGWSTPLRATNRVLTGPFKSTDEAQDFVNRMSKAGLSGFVFTSAKGQKVERLRSK